MNPAQLLAHFDRISDAPDAIPRLRRFILDLAVRGRLVEQDPHDEPASVLLKRIHSEKARLVKQGSFRSSREIESSQEVDQPFLPPATWVWCRLSEVGAIVGGGTPPSGDLDNFTAGGSGTAWLTPADLGKHPGLFVSHGARDLTQQGLRSSSVTVMPMGSVLFTSRAPIGYTAIAANEISTNQGFKSVVPAIPACNLYIAVYFRAFGKMIDEKASGTTFREVSGKTVANLPFPLPPLAEQHRIVARVDELMALCDRLEAAQTERESRRDRLVAASLHCINQPAQASAFPRDVRSYLSHISRLTIRTEHIQQLRQTILNLAVRGKLVPQDPNDEPVSDLLRRIRADKAQLMKAGKLRAETTVTPLDAGEGSFVIPSSWVWARLGDVIHLVSGQHLLPGEYSDQGQSGLPYITGPADFGPNGLVITRYAVVRKAVAGKGQVLLTVKGAGVGKTAVCDLPEVAISRQLMAMTPIGWDQRFLLITTHRLAEVLKESARSLIPGISREDVDQFVFPLPPFSEQHRIVAKVDELMALCDQLEAQLTAAQTESRRLLESTLHQALNGGLL